MSKKSDFINFKYGAALLISSLNPENEMNLQISDNGGDNLVVGYRLTVSSSTQMFAIGQDSLIDSIGWGGIIGRDHSLTDSSHYSVILGGRTSIISGSSTKRNLNFISFSN